MGFPLATPELPSGATVSSLLAGLSIENSLPARQESHLCDEIANENQLYQSLFQHYHIGECL
jgi:hypothetical protein